MSATHPEPDVDIVKVAMKADRPARPPHFEFRWFLPQRGIHHVWSAGADHYGIPWWTEYASELTKDLPLYAYMDADDGNRLTVACSETVRRVSLRTPILEEDMGFQCAFILFREPQQEALAEYAVEFRFDRRRRFYGETIQDGVAWMEASAGLRPLEAPDAAFEPLYSTWYDFHQHVSAEALERECARAEKLGMKSVILDDGWQIDLPDEERRAWTGYRYAGDWKPGHGFPDMAAHVGRVQGLGFRYLVWFSVPLVGCKTANDRRFGDKFLPGEFNGARALDPRFPEVRDHLVSTLVEAVREWKLDGLKLDFLEHFKAVEGEDPIRPGDGRDIASVPLAAKALLDALIPRLKSVNPGILIEFRQSYVGPAMRQYGNMLRATDCPLSMTENRTRIARLRLTSGGTAVHSDMLEWREDETTESAARCVLNSIFGVVQYSVHLDRLPADHLRMIGHWIRFSREHRKALVRGRFRPHGPAFGYPLLEGESADERIFGVYQRGLTVRTGPLDRPVIVLNATDDSRLSLDLPGEATLATFDTCGSPSENQTLAPGLNRVVVPRSGFVVIRAK